MTRYHDPSARIEYELVPDGPVRRAFSAVNVRRDDKDAFDQLQKWWSMREERDMTQWEVFTRVLALALMSPEADLPPRGLWKGP